MPAGGTEDVIDHRLDDRLGLITEQQFQDEAQPSSVVSSMFAGWVNRVARVFPSDLSKLALAGAPHPELATLVLLRKRLSDDFTVFHGVHWSREYAKWTHFGEVDFVVVNRNGDVLLIEQKNGALVDGDDGLVKQYEDGDKNVNDQIRRSVDKVHQKFKRQHGAKRKLALDYLIYCSDHRVREGQFRGARHEPYRRRRREGLSPGPHSIGSGRRRRQCGRLE